MPDYNEHVRRSNENLQFLEKIRDFDNYWDWKVTVSFYSALHLINAHIAIKIDHHYRTHNQVEKVINPFKNLSTTKLDEDTYTSYMALQNLSRRARYLVHEKRTENNRSATYFTFDKHLKKALYHLDKVISFFEKEHKIPISRIKLPKNLTVKDAKCIEFY